MKINKPLKKRNQTISFALFLTADIFFLCLPFTLFQFSLFCLFRLCFFSSHAFLLSVVSLDWWSSVLTTCQRKQCHHLISTDMQQHWSIHKYCPVGWGCRIHRLLLCRGVRPTPNKCPGYDTKQSDGEVPAMLELWGMRSTPSLPSLPGPLWPGVVAPDRALSMG